MPECYSAEEVIKDKFLFVSYAHEDKPVVEKCLRFLLDEGVRLWYDKDLKAGDEWPVVVEGMMRNPNCCGVLLFCSAASLVSKNVAKERAVALDEREKRGVRDYPVFFVIVTQDKPLNYIKIIKQAFDKIDEERIDSEFPLDNLSVFMRLIGNDAIYRMTHKPDIENTMLEDIRKVASRAINKTVIFRERLEAHANADKIVTIDIGRWNINGDTRPIKWRFVQEKDEIAILLCEEVLREGPGGTELADWLNGEFMSGAFNDEERALLYEAPRLLMESETKAMEKDDLATGQQWWLSETRGNLQMIIREDGTVYRNGYNNKMFEKGIRPAITIRMEDVSKWIEK